MRQLWIILGLVFYIFYTLAYLVFHFWTHQEMLEFMDHMECYTHNPKKIWRTNGFGPLGIQLCVGSLLWNLPTEYVQINT